MDVGATERHSQTHWSSGLENFKSSNPLSYAGEPFTLLVMMNFEHNLLAQYLVGII
jgi:hypothetical protein